MIVWTSAGPEAQRVVSGAVSGVCRRLTPDEPPAEWSATITDLRGLGPRADEIAGRLDALFRQAVIEATHWGVLGGYGLGATWPRSPEDLDGWADRAVGHARAVDHGLQYDESESFPER